MRPRLFAAEIIPSARIADGKFGASMRPRLFAAEISRGQRGCRSACRASMRPRLFAAEIARPSSFRSSGSSRFNEAAAIRRGNRWRWRARTSG